MKKLQLQVIIQFKFQIIQLQTKLRILMKILKHGLKIIYFQEKNVKFKE